MSRVFDSTKWYDFCEKHKWANWIDDNIIWYCIDKPTDIYKSVRHWFACNWNKEHWNLIKKAFTSYGWDGGFIYRLEEAQIDKQLKWFSEHQRMVDSQYEQITRTLKIAKKLVHIINDDSELFHFTGDLKFDDLNDSEVKVFRVSRGDLQYYYDGPRVNWRNAKRFCTTYQLNSEYWRSHEHEYYKVKAIALYHRIRAVYTEYWWD